MPKQSTVIVTDSTSDIPKYLAEKWDIRVVPLRVVFGDKAYRDRVDIHPRQFYEMLAKSNSLPTTSQPTPHEFQEIYQSLLQEYDNVLSIHLSSGLSGTIEAAKQGASHFDGKVIVWDSLSISLGAGMQVVRAAEAIQNGTEIDTVVNMLEDVRRSNEVLFTLDTLEYLHKGGRIGKAASLLGSVLNIKPIIRVEDGIYNSIAKARSQKRAIQMMVNKIRELASNKKVVYLGVAHGAAEAAAEHLMKELEDIFEIKAKLFTEVGPVIGVHTGPGTVGAVIQYK